MLLLNDMTTGKQDTATTGSPYTGKKVLIVGLGKTGMAAVRFFLQQGSDLFVSDSSPKGTIEPEILAWLEENRITCETGFHSAELFLAADLIFVSPGIPLSIPALSEARRNSVTIIGELAVTGPSIQ